LCMRAITGFYLVRFYGEWQYFHTWINGHACMSLGKYWKRENLTIFTMCDPWEQEYMCWARLTHWVWSFRLLFYIRKGNITVPIYTQVWYRWELIHLTSRLRLWYSGIIDIIVFVYNCIKVFNRLASEQYFLTLEIQLIWYQHLRWNSHSTLPVEDQADDQADK
jgi:hypothetical protein